MRDFIAELERDITGKWVAIKYLGKVSACQLCNYRDFEEVSYGFGYTQEDLLANLKGTEEEAIASYGHDNNINLVQIPSEVMDGMVNIAKGLSGFSQWETDTKTKTKMEETKNYLLNYGNVHDALTGIQN